MPIDPTRVHTHSIRRPKSELPELRELARKLGTTPAKLIMRAFVEKLPQFRRESQRRPAPT